MGTSDWISSGSLAVAFAAFIYSWLTDKKLKKQQIQINEQALAKHKEEDEDKKKALIEANSIKDGKSWKIRIYNRGKATARNIELISEDLFQDNGIYLIGIEKKNPYLLLHPQTSYEISMMLTIGHKTSPIIRFIWDDDFQEGNTWEQVLDL